MTATLVADMENADYHASPGLSASGAKLLLPPSCPALFKHERENPVYKGAYDYGSAAHKLVLGDAQANLVIVEADSWRSKAAREQRQEAREAGAIPILRKQYEPLVAMAAKIREHPIAAYLFDPAGGNPEQSVFWTDEQTGVQLRARFDWLPNPTGGRVIIPDYKTAACSEPGKFAKTVMDLNYHIQAAWYLEAARQLELPDPAFVFVAQEKEAPYLVTVCELDPFALLIGRHLMRQAIDLYAKCTAEDNWPGYTDEVASVSLPPYYTKQFEEIL